MTRELDTVVLSRDLPEHGLKQGDIGAVVHCYKGGESFEVEFITGQGETVAVVTLKTDDVRMMQDKEILHVRKLQAA
jgi:putative heme iron utilization protein